MSRKAVAWLVFIAGLALGPCVGYLLYRGLGYISIGVCAAIWVATVKVSTMISPSRRKDFPKDPWDDGNRPDNTGDFPRNF